MTVKSSDTLGVVARAFALLVRLAGDNPGTVLYCFQRIIDDPPYRRQVWSTMTGQPVVGEITEQEWADRENDVLAQLGLGGNLMLMARQLGSELTVNHYFTPAGLTRRPLIELARKIGMEIHSAPNSSGDDILTEAGVLECDLATIMQPTDAYHRPFNLNYDDQLAYVKRQNGDDLTSAEETLYLLIRHFMVFNRIIFMGGWIRCRNRYGSVRKRDHICVGFSGDGELRVRWEHDVNSDRWCGAIPRKFTPLKT